MSDFHFEHDHADDSVLKPILLALGILAAFAGVLITIAFLAGSVFG